MSGGGVTGGGGVTVGSCLVKLVIAGGLKLAGIVFLLFEGGGVSGFVKSVARASSTVRLS